MRSRLHLPTLIATAGMLATFALVHHHRTRPPGFPYLHEDLYALIDLAEKMAANLTNGTLDPLQLDNLEGTGRTVLDSCRWLANKRAIDPATCDAPPLQANFIHANLNSLTTICRDVLDTLASKPLSRDTVTQLSDVYTDTITSLRWLLNHFHTPTGKLLHNDLRNTAEAK